MSEQPPSSGQGAPGASGPPKYPQSPPGQPPPGQPPAYPPPPPGQSPVYPPPPPGQSPAYPPPPPGQSPAYPPPHARTTPGRTHRPRPDSPRCHQRHGRPRPAATAHPGGRCPRRTRRGEGGSRHGRRPSSPPTRPGWAGGSSTSSSSSWCTWCSRRLSAPCTSAGSPSTPRRPRASTSGATSRCIAWVVQIAVVLLYGAHLLRVRAGPDPGHDGRLGAGPSTAGPAGPSGSGGPWPGPSFEWLLWVFFFIPWVIDMLFPALGQAPPDAPRQGVEHRGREGLRATGAAGGRGRRPGALWSEPHRCSSSTGCGNPR